MIIFIIILMYFYLSIDLTANLSKYFKELDKKESLLAGRDHKDNEKFLKKNIIMIFFLIPIVYIGWLIYSTINELFLKKVKELVG